MEKRFYDALAVIVRTSPCVQWTASVTEIFRQSKMSGQEVKVSMARICILLLVLAVAALGQTSTDLGAKYPHVAAYKVRPEVLMTASFGADGQACEMTLEKRMKQEKRTTNDSGIVIGDSFSEQEVRSLVDDLVPEDLRGRDLTRRFNGTIEGRSVTREYTYENLIVRMYGTRSDVPGLAPDYSVIIITWPKRSCGEAKAVVR